MKPNPLALCQSSASRECGSAREPRRAQTSRDTTRSAKAGAQHRTSSTRDETAAQGAAARLKERAAPPPLPRSRLPGAPPCPTRSRTGSKRFVAHVGESASVSNAAFWPHLPVPESRLAPPPCPLEEGLALHRLSKPWPQRVRFPAAPAPPLPRGRGDGTGRAARPLRTLPHRSQRLQRSPPSRPSHAHHARRYSPVPARRAAAIGLRCCPSPWRQWRGGGGSRQRGRAVGAAARGGGGGGAGSFNGFRAELRAWGCTGLAGGAAFSPGALGAGPAGTSGFPGFPRRRVFPRRPCSVTAATAGPRAEGRPCVAVTRLSWKQDFPSDVTSQKK